MQSDCVFGVASYREKLEARRTCSPPGPLNLNYHSSHNNPLSGALRAALYCVIVIAVRALERH